MPASPFNHIQLLRYASLFTYACVGIPLLQYETVVAEMLEGNRPAYFYDLWLGCYLAFGLVFWFLTHDMGARNPSGLRRLVQILLLLVLNLLAIAVGWLSQSGLCALLLVVVSVALPWILNLQVGVAWMVLQNFSLLPLFASWPNYSLSQAIWQAAMYLGISTTSRASRPRRARSSAGSIPNCAPPARCWRNPAAWPNAPASRANCTICSATTSPR
jgi:hypothetical protein